LGLDSILLEGITSAALDPSDFVGLLPMNAPPLANDDSYSVHAGEVLTVAAGAGLLANDSDADGDAINATSIEAPVNGTINIAADGSFDYTPNAGFVGTEVLTYTVSDGTTFSQAEVTIAVANTPPAAVDDSYSVHAGEVLTVAAGAGLLANDSDADGDAINVTSIEAPANGTINIAADGSFDYMPNAGFVGTEVLTYTVSDGTTFSQAEVTITVGNTPPVFGSYGPFEVLENTAAVGSVVATDPDGDALTYSIEGGADAALFDIDPVTGALSFLTAPDYENPADDGKDNVYDLIVGVTDDFLFLTIATVQVAVTDEDEGAGPNLIVGTAGRDILVSTGDVDQILFNGGYGDVGVGNGGGDIFDFSVNVINGSLDSTRIMDWSEGDTILGFDYDDIHPETFRSSSTVLRFAYGPDDDVLTITGDVSGGLESLFEMDLA
ncbi:Ig-like domain-containing protein, partial [Rhodovulum sulfidophilum]|uniref:Ig-like domain-containing protein n=1 Tax=Rhodovulum sulfidophilum TaxID=35806 RepID=UPI0013897C93